MKCQYHLDGGRCRLSFPESVCEGEDKCTFYQLDAKRLCPSCGKEGAGWSGYGKHGGLKYSCWNCRHVWVEFLVWSKTPGRCLRCGREYENPVPPVVREGRREIATVEWCADCNKLVMSVVFREISAYRDKDLYDPVRQRHSEEG